MKKEMVQSRPANAIKIFEKITHQSTISTQTNNTKFSERKHNHENENRNKVA